MLLHAIDWSSSVSLCCSVAAALSLLFVYYWVNSSVPLLTLLLLLLIDPLLLLLKLLIGAVINQTALELWGSTLLISCSFLRRRSIVAADQFFPVSPSNAKRIGVPSLLRTESTTRLQHCNKQFVHSHAFVGSILILIVKVVGSID